jgi:LPXTG-site transpeptidase (sortase) family protein
MANRFFSFIFVFLALFALSFLFLASVDALPEPIPTEPSTHDTTAPVVDWDVSSPELPVRVVAQSIGLDSRVVNPMSADLDTLNKAVDEAAMRHPAGAMLGEQGTVLLFGHSSYLPIVRNQVFKTFNGIQKLKQGAIVSVYSGTHEYRYAVTGVRVANAQEDVVQLPSNGQYLTLVTCDSFGSKSDRYVVTAEFAGAYAL